MLNLRGIRAPLLAGLISAGVVGCEHDLTLSPPVNPGDAVVAQFDPTNPIPVLQLVPTPTALAEEPGTGRLKVAVYDCEKPSTKQCLAFVDNFPPTTPVTLFFSAAIDEASLAEGVTIVKEGSGTAIPFTATVGDRPQPNAACAEGGNGSGNPADPSDDRTYDPAKDVAPGIQAILRPNTPLDPGATYYVYVESYVDDAGVVHGVKTADGKKIEPSNLFALLNAPKDHPPITNGAEGPQLVSPLLRSNVSSLVLAALFPSKTLADLTPDEEVPVLLVDLNDSEADKVLATFDPLSALAEADNAKLQALLDQIENVGVAQRRFDLIDYPALAQQLLPHMIRLQGRDQRLCTAHRQALQQIPANPEQADDSGFFFQRTLDNLKTISRSLPHEQLVKPEIGTCECCLRGFIFLEPRALIPAAGHQHVGQEHEFTEAASKRSWMGDQQTIQMGLQRQYRFSGFTGTGEQQRLLLTHDLRIDKGSFECPDLRWQDRRGVDFFLSLLLNSGRRLCFARIRRSELPEVVLTDRVVAGLRA